MPWRKLETWTRSSTFGSEVCFHVANVYVNRKEKHCLTYQKDIIGPNHAFVGQSGIFPKKWTDFPEAAAAEMKATEEAMVKVALVDEIGVEATPTSMTLFRLFTG